MIYNTERLEMIDVRQEIKHPVGRISGTLKIINMKTF